MNNNENYFKDNFTKEGEKVNLEINKLTAECITSKNNKFSLDSEGNLNVNSITINESNSQIGGNPFPIGSIYMNVNSTNPSELFGGTWEQIQDRFLLACGNTYSNGSMGGNATINLQHRHSFNLKGTSEYTLNSWGCHIIGPSSVDAVSSANIITSYNGNANQNILPPYLAVYVWKRVA